MSIEKLIEVRLESLRDKGISDRDLVDIIFLRIFKHDTSVAMKIVSLIENDVYGFKPKNETNG